MSPLEEAVWSARPISSLLCGITRLIKGDVNQSSWTLSPAALEL